jgi:hypothetical protein
MEQHLTNTTLSLEEPLLVFQENIAEPKIEYLHGWLRG